LGIAVSSADSSGPFAGQVVSWERNLFWELVSVIFEPGLQLRAIETDAFIGSESLNRKNIPVFLDKVSVGGFPASRTLRIRIKRGNRHFQIGEVFIMDLNGDLIGLYCRPAAEVPTSEKTEAIGDYYFSFCDSIRLVKFGSACRLGSIEFRAFRSCQRLKTIKTPSRIA
jgi:hypothetical protein